MTWWGCLIVIIVVLGVGIPVVTALTAGLIELWKFTLDQLGSWHLDWSMRRDRKRRRAVQKQRTDAIEDLKAMNNQAHEIWD